MRKHRLQLITMMTAVLFLVSVFFAAGPAFAEKKIVIGKLVITLEAAYHQMVSWHAQKLCQENVWCRS